MASSAHPSTTTPSLWDKAFNSLDANLRNGLMASTTHKRDILAAVLTEVEAKRAVFERKKWKFKKPNGDTVIVRHLLEKIAAWVKTFQSVGDVAVQFDPIHAALPWAAFRFLLQTVVSDVEVFGVLMSDLEVIAQIITRYREFESLYLEDAKSETELMLESTLTRLYGEILGHLARAMKLFQESSATRSLKSFFRVASPTQMRKIQSQDEEAQKLARLLDSGTLRIIKNVVINQSNDAIASAATSVSEKKHTEIMDWISAQPYRKCHHFVSDSRPSGAGEWLLSHHGYTEWQSSSSPSLLLLHGIIGSGKSTLFSLVVDSWLSDLDNGVSTASLAYFYCGDPDFDNAHLSCDDVLRTILGQLAIDWANPENVSTCIVAEFERQEARSSVNKLDIPKLRTRGCVQLILELAEQQDLAIMIDAIDSIEENERHGLIAALQEILAQADNVVKIFITSRSNGRTIAAIAPNEQIRITSGKTAQDMGVFVTQLVDTVVANRLLLGGDVPPGLRSLLVRTLIDGAGEMFLWAKLQVDRFCRGNHQDDVIATLQTKLPETLEQLYHETLDYIFNNGTRSREIAVRVFSWVLYMREPLTPAAFLAVLSSADEGSELQLPQITTICANLVLLDTKRDAVCFVHQSVREFLVGQGPFAPEAAHRLLASACIETAARGLPPTETFGSPGHDFGVYAAMYWPVHTKMAGDAADSQSILQKVTAFMLDEDFDTTLSFDSWLRTIRKVGPSLARDHVMKPDLNSIPDSNTGPLFTISVFGLDNLLGVVFKNGEGIDVNERNEHGQTPVYLAAGAGHARTVSMLVDRGADINIAFAGKHGSPLHAACFKGHLEVVETLLELEVDVASGGIYEDALQAAFLGSQEGVALRLNEHDGVVTTEEDYERFLEGAARSGFVRVIERLQSLQFVSKYQGKADKLSRKIRKAIEGGELNVLRQFLDTQVNGEDFLPPDSVYLATLHTHRNMLEFVLERGASIEAEGLLGTPLRTASLLNSESLVRFLVNRGANVNACGQFGAALQAAASKGHTSVVKLLVDEGADVDQQTGFFGTALQAAAYNGQEETVEFLLSVGAGVHIEGYSRDAFHAAAEGGHQNILMLMLRKGYRFRSPPPGPMGYRIPPPPPPPPYKTILRDASPGRVPHSSRAEFRSAGGEWPLFDLHAIYDVARGGPMSLRHGPKNASTAEETSRLHILVGENHPLWTAASAGHGDTVKLLLDQKSRLEISDLEVSEALTIAASKCHLDVIKTILDFLAQSQALNYIKLVLNEGLRSSQPQVIELALTMATKTLSVTEAEELRGQTQPAAIKYRGRRVDREELISDFQRACGNGDKALLGAITESEHYKALSEENLNAGLRAGVLNGQGISVRIILESAVPTSQLEISVQDAFVAAAAHGFKGMMISINSYCSTRFKLMDDTVTISLAISSENGHLQVVRYLVEDLQADVNKHAPDTQANPRTSNLETGEIPDSIDTQANACVLVEPPIISPLQAALRGFARFSPSPIKRYTHPAMTSPKSDQEQRAGQAATAEVLMFLLQNGANPNDLGGQDTYPIHSAAKLCPLHIIEGFISAGADVNVSQCGHETALFAAAGRELSSAPIVETLLAAGAIIPKEHLTETNLLEQALCYFHVKIYNKKFPCILDYEASVASHNLRPFLPGDSHHRGAQAPPRNSFSHADGYFLEAASLEYVFKEGSGAVLFNLLTRMPHAAITGQDWSLVLQMAAVLDNRPFVDLLLSRGTDVNAVEGYYGTALEGASRFGHMSVVQRLLDSGAQVNAIGGRWHTALQAALSGGHEGVVHTLLSHGADLKLQVANQDNARDESPLQLGVLSGKLGIVKALLGNEKGLVHGKPESLSPLVLAAKSGFWEITKELLDSGAPVNIFAPKRHGYSYVIQDEASPIHAAVSHGHLSVIRLLLAHGADVELDVEGVPKPLCLAAAKGHAGVVEILLSAGAKINDGEALYAAVKHRNIEAARELVTAGSPVSSLAFDLACKTGRPDMVEVLIERVYDGENPGAVVTNAMAIPGINDTIVSFLLDYAMPTREGISRNLAEGSTLLCTKLAQIGHISFDQPDNNGDYPLQIAATNLHPKAVSLLLSRGVHVDCHRRKSGTPLELALEVCARPDLLMISSKSHELVQRLPRPATLKGIYPDNPDHWPPIHFLDEPMVLDAEQVPSILRCERIVQLLVGQGATLSNSGRPFGPPLHLACFIGNQSMVQVLIRNGAQINEAGGFFEKAIFAAVQGGHPDVIRLLLDHDPRTNQTHSEHATPLHLACANGHAACVRSLLEYGANATALDSENRTPLTVALHTQSPSKTPGLNEETVVEALVRTARNLRICDDDLVMAAQHDYRGSQGNLSHLLTRATDRIVPEGVICRVVGGFYFPDEKVLGLLVQRAGGIGVTDKMLNACRSAEMRQALLKYRDERIGIPYEAHASSS